MIGRFVVGNNPMCVEGTPVEHYPDLGLYVKREDLSCPPGPHFSKTRGVYAHIAKRPERIIGCLDTSHSQGGWATAQACKLLGKKAVVYHPITKADRAKPDYTPPPQQQEAFKLGATLEPLQAGRSAVLYHGAKKHLESLRLGTRGPSPVYMMPNALKLPEMIDETVAEVLRTPLPPVDLVIISASSGTIAAGVISGLCQKGYTGGIIVHQGYSRPAHTIRNYMAKMVGEFYGKAWVEGTHPGEGVKVWREDFTLVDEGYAYGDSAPAFREDQVPFPSNKFYDRKALAWWLDAGIKQYGGPALLWNIG